MSFIIIGASAFIFLYVFDINKVKYIHKHLNICFLLGVSLLAISTIGVLSCETKSFELYFPLRVFFGILAAISLLLIPYALFFALPFRKTYIETENKNTVVDQGMYALCRHPGVMWFFFFYFFLWLTSGKMTVMWAGMIWTIMDIIHVYVQDRWLFPKTLIGYDSYQEKVPFLVPNLKSIKQLLSDS